jgi:hypothetical protein
VSAVLTQIQPAERFRDACLVEFPDLPGGKVETNLLREESTELAAYSHKP